jgi:hypothetical protein
MMAHAFDTLGYAQRLRDAGVPQDQAEAHAAAARDFLGQDFGQIESKIDALADRFEALERRIDRFEASIDARLATLETKLTVRFGGMIAAGIGMLYALNKLT